MGGQLTGDDIMRTPFDPMGVGGAVKDDPVGREVVINITQDTQPSNIYDLAIEQGYAAEITEAVDVTVNVYAGVKAGSMDTGVFKPGSTMKINNLGTISGKGGDGGTIATLGGRSGLPGGDALVLRMDVSIDNGGTIQGGGGGGGASGGALSPSPAPVYDSGPGGGGAGYPAGAGSENGSSSSADGTLTAGGAGGVAAYGGSMYGNGGDGGKPGSAGKNGVNSAGAIYTGEGGDPGRAIATNGKNINWLNYGTVTGNIV